MQSCPLYSGGEGSCCLSSNGQEKDWEKIASRIEAPPELSSERATSSIPSENGHWTYPSEKQFYKATTLKGHKVLAESVPSVVAIHNAVNEETWRQIMKPNDLSLKARVRHWGGFDKPFDRHDWMIDRCGTDVRYIIDFYDGKSNGGQVSIFVDARPDMSTLGNVWDRVRMFLRNSLIGKWLS